MSVKNITNVTVIVLANKPSCVYAIDCVIKFQRFLIAELVLCMISNESFPKTKTTQKMLSCLLP